MMIENLENIHLPSTDCLPEIPGFRNGNRGVITSRTIMFDELQLLLDSLPMEAGREDYRNAIIEKNVLGKATLSSRRQAAKKLLTLYALDMNIIIFRILRFLWGRDSSSHRLLACLCANARDPIFRMTGKIILSTRMGDPVMNEEIEVFIAKGSGERYKPSSLKATAGRVISSWTQSGHLNGKNVRIRMMVNPTTAAVAYALFLGYLQGIRGESLFTTYWTALLDTTPDQLDTLAFEASRLDLIDYRRGGDITDIGFSFFLNSNWGVKDGQNRDPHKKL